LLLVLAAHCAGRPQGAAPTILSGAAFAQTPCPECPVEDSMVFETYYPSPYGLYEELRGDKIIVGDTQGSVIGQTESTLPPPGTLTFNPLTDEPTSSDGTLYEGSLYYKKSIGATPGKLRYYDGSIWNDLGGGGSVRLENYATSSLPACSNAILGTLIYDITEKRPYVCALNASNSPVWKPLDSDYDKDGITDAVDYIDTDPNDATATETDVAQGKTFYSGGVQPKNRKTGTLNAIRGAFVHMEVGADAGHCGGNSSCKSYQLYSSVGEVSIDVPYNPPIYFLARPFRCKSPFSERQIYSLCISCGNPWGSCCYLTHICE